MGNSCNQNQKKQGGANQEKDNNKTFPPFPFLSLLVEPRSGERFAASEASSEAATKQQTKRGWLWDTICFFPFEKFWGRQSGKDFSKENKAFYSKIYNVLDRGGKGSEKDPIKPVFKPKNRGWRLAVDK